MKKLVVFVVSMLAILIVWQIMSSTSLHPAALAVAENEDKVATGALPPSAVLKIDPRVRASGAASSGRNTTDVQLPSTVSPLLGDFIARKDYAALMAKVSQLPNDPEATFLRAQLLQRCATQTDAVTDAKPQKTRDERRATFVASLSPGHPDTQQRIAAYDSVNMDVCGELRSLQTTSKEIGELTARAIDLKDPAALAFDAACETFAANGPNSTGRRAPEINSSRAERFRQALASRNPIAVRTAVGMLGNSYSNGAFRIGTDGALVDPHAMSIVATILGCQYGADCGIELQRACANEGKCGANNFEDYLSYYRLSPSDAQTVESYRAQLTQMIDSGNFSQLQLVMGDQPTDSVWLNIFHSCPTRSK